ncbi:unnamed protein product, partial [marine sediment metagenome]
ANTDITVKAGLLHAIWGYAMETQPTADQCCATTVSITSDDFAEHGPFKFAWNFQQGGIANRASSGVDLTVIETDRTFAGDPTADKTVSCVTTTRDAMTGDGVSNWGLVYS